MRFFFSFCAVLALLTCFPVLQETILGREQPVRELQQKDPGGGFEKQLQTYLTDKLKDYTSWSILEIQPNGGILTFVGYSVDTLRPLTVNGSFIYVPVLIDSKAGKLKSLLSVRMKLRKMALVAVHDIPVNTELQLSDFVQQEIDATSIRGKLITEYEELALSKSKMFIKSGLYLTDQMVRKRSLIKHGDQILCYLVNGSVTISLDCTARDDGNPGEVIHVVTTDKRIYKAKIENAKRARIIE